MYNSSVPSTSQALTFTISGAVGDATDTSGTTAGSTQAVSAAVAAAAASTRVGLVNTAENSKVTFKDLTAEDTNKMTSKLNEVAEIAQSQNINISNVAAFSVSATDATVSNGAVLFAMDGILASDAANDLVRVYAVKDDGTWEELVYSTADGLIAAYFPDGFSNVVIVRTDESMAEATADYNTSRGKISGAVSPKTGETYPYATMVAFVSLAGVCVCLKKREAKN
jgi:hypothetical protein